MYNSGKVISLQIPKIGRSILLVFLCFHSFIMIAQDKKAEDPFENPTLNWQVGKIFTISGEVGARMEYMHNEQFAENDSTADDDNRYRERVRLRFGGDIKPTKWLSAGFRFSTGQSTYPASGWSSFSDGFKRDPVSLDRIYINFHYKIFELKFGANGNPNFHPSDMVWDSDIQPAGFSQIIRPGRWEIVLGQYMLTEYRDLNAPELSGSYLFSNNVFYSPNVTGNLKVGLFQYYYNKPDVVAYAIQNGLLDQDFKTNRLKPNDSTQFFSNYHTLGANFVWSRGNWQLLGELAVNLNANQDPSLGRAYAEKENVAYGFLLRYGTLQKVGSMSLEAGYFHIQADAVIAAFNSDDYQQTNVNSIPVFFSVRLPGNTTLVWDTYFQKRINTALFLSGGIQHDENATKIRSRITIQLGF